MIIWIASYPKSGNTWVRSFLSSYIFNQGKKFNFEDLEKIRAFPSDEEINFLKQNHANKWVGFNTVLNLCRLTPNQPK